MMDNFAQILRRISTTMEGPSTKSHFRGVIPFKVQVKFDIPLFECQIDVDALEKWLSLLEGYFSVQNFSNSEKITFALLKALPHVIYWWDTYCEQHAKEESIIFGPGPTWEVLLMPSRNNITLLKIMMTSTRDGPHYAKRGAKWCQISQIPSIPCTPSWVSNTLSIIWS
jgi:hypothetical protein